MIVQHPVGQEVTGLRIDDDWDGDATRPRSATIKNVTAQQPNVTGGYGYSRVTFSYVIPTCGTDMSCGFFSRHPANRRQQRPRPRPSRQRRGDRDHQLPGQVHRRRQLQRRSPGLRLGPLLGPATATSPRPVTPGDRGQLLVGLRRPRHRLPHLRRRVRRHPLAAPQRHDRRGRPAPRPTASTATTTRPRTPRSPSPTAAAGSSRASCSRRTATPRAAATGSRSAPPTSTACAPPSITLSPSATRPNTGTGASPSPPASAPTPTAADGGRAEYVEWDLDNNGSFETTTLVRHRHRPDHRRRRELPTDDRRAPPGETAGLDPHRQGPRHRQRRDGRRRQHPPHQRRRHHHLHGRHTCRSANDQTVTTESDTGQGDHPDRRRTPTGTRSPTRSSTSPTTGSSARPRAGACNSGTGADALLPARRQLRRRGHLHSSARTDDHNGQSPPPATVTVNVTPQTEITAQPDATSGQRDRHLHLQLARSRRPAHRRRRSPSSAGSTAPRRPTSSPALARSTTPASPTAPTPSTSGRGPAQLRRPDPGHLHLDASTRTLPGHLHRHRPDRPDATRHPPTFTFHSDEPTRDLRVPPRRRPRGTAVAALHVAARPTPALTEGEHTFEVRATDAVRPHRPDPGQLHLARRPDRADGDDRLRAATNPTNQQTAELRVLLDRPRPPPSSAASTRRLGAFAPCTSPEDLRAASARAPHTFEVRATDPAGNAGPVADFNWEIDITVPETTIARPGPPDPTTRPVASFELHLQRPDGRLRVPPRSARPAPGRSAPRPQLYADLADGSHTFEVRATRRRRQQGRQPRTARPGRSTRPRRRPRSTPGPSGTTGSTSRHVRVHLGRRSGRDLRVQARRRPAWETELHSPQDLPGPSPTAPTPSASGRPTRSATSTPTPATRTWTIDTDAPDRRRSTPARRTRRAPSAATFQFSADEPGATFECRLDSNAAARLRDLHLAGGADAGLDDGATHLRGPGHRRASATRARPTRAPGRSTRPRPDVSITGRGCRRPPARRPPHFAFTQHRRRADLPVPPRRRRLAGLRHVAGKTYTGLDEGAHTFEVRGPRRRRQRHARAGADTWTVVDSDPPDTYDRLRPGRPDRRDHRATSPSRPTSRRRLQLPVQARQRRAPAAAAPAPDRHQELHRAWRSGHHTFTRARHRRRRTRPDARQSGPGQVSSPPSGGGGTAGAGGAKSPAITPGKGPLKRGRGTAGDGHLPDRAVHGHRQGQGQDRRRLLPRPRQGHQPARRRQRRQRHGRPPEGRPHRPRRRRQGRSQACAHRQLRAGATSARRSS